MQCKYTAGQCVESAQSSQSRHQLCFGLSAVEFEQVNSSWVDRWKRIKQISL